MKYFALTRVIWIKKLGQWGKRERLMEFFRLKIAQEIVFFPPAVTVEQKNLPKKTGIWIEFWFDTSTNRYHVDNSNCHGPPTTSFHI